MTSPPRTSCAISAARFAIVPDGTNSASSLPVSSRAEALELVDGRIVAARGIAERRGGDRRHHLRRRQRDGVAAEVVDAG